MAKDTYHRLGRVNARCVKGVGEEIRDDLTQVSHG